MTPPARVQAAIELLDGIILAARDNGPAADTLIAAYFKARRYAGSKDRRAVRDLIYAAIRRAGEPPESGRAAMLGLASENAELAALFDGSPHGPLPRDEREPIASAAAVPSWLLPLIAAPLDKDEQAALLERAPLDLRVNRLKASREQVLAQLPEGVPTSLSPDGVRLPEGTPIEQSPLWREGLVEVQDEGSQLIARLCEAQPGQTVIDLCAGAGGKTLALAADMQGRGRLIASDTIRSRLARLAPRAERAGASFIETLLLDQGHEAGRLEPLAAMADCVLVDAPCSGTGTWRRNPEARWRLNPLRLERLVAEQARIMDSGAGLVKQGGTMVYAVCSLLDKEGRDQVDAFLRRNPGWAADLPRDMPGRRWGAGILLSPAHDRSDGFFFTRMKKSC
ncbi:MAG TPA: RsmB/NOP family class I SAM-dependent RNA methyltransferase [Rhizorhapis sp.]|nr:RsmB/NOP family class I SAM-dependent RNA methyltransferase [Rhizorhapis sp.]